MDTSECLVLDAGGYTIELARHIANSKKKGNPLADPWHCNWADRVNKPSQKSLDSWTLSSWLRAKAKDSQKALADINHTLAIIGGKDEVIQKCLTIELEILGYLTERFPVDAPVLGSYQPSMVDRVWVGSRLKELERQRDTFSTYSFWKDPRPEKELANKALNLVTTGIGRYTIVSVQDWRGVVEVLQGYTNQLEELQLFLIVARNEQGFDGAKWSGSVARLNKTIRASLRDIHRTILEDTKVSYPALRVRPWRIDEGVDQVMTWEQFLKTPYEFWDKDRMGPPRLTDGPVFDQGSTWGVDDLIDHRRQEIDLQLTEFRAGRFGVVKGFLRRERKIWGKAQISVAQFKRWGVFPE